MNATIEKIVSLLFEDLAESEEISQIREEILQNCQERYHDLREAGISEDDAIHAVIESLSGMEEMLSEYPRKSNVADPAVQPPEPHETCEEDGLRSWSCDPAVSPISEIHMEHMASADVFVCVSPDHLLHVECSNPELTLLTGIENGVLTIALSQQSEEEIRFSFKEGVDLSSIGKMFEKLAKRFASAVSIKGGAEITLSVPAGLCPAVQIGTSSGDVTIDPQKLERMRIGTASGNVEADGVTLQTEMRVTSASGDITLTSVTAQQMQLSSASGDIEASDCFIRENVRLNTTSGDISWCRKCQKIEVSTVSGDVELEGSAEIISFRTVSGDVEISPKTERLQAVSGSTTSGDAVIYLPEGMKAEVSCATVSGEIYNHAGSLPGAPAAVKISTVSGDIEIN